MKNLIYTGKDERDKAYIVTYRFYDDYTYRCDHWPPPHANGNDWRVDGDGEVYANNACISSVHPFRKEAKRAHDKIIWNIVIEELLGE